MALHSPQFEEVLMADGHSHTSVFCDICDQELFRDDWRKEFHNAFGSETCPGYSKEYFSERTDY